jgi:prepilin-type processing-associated H-X9-DG protein
VLGLAIMLIALVVTVPAGRRVKRLREEAEGGAGAEESVAVGLAGFAVGCGLLLGTLVLLVALLPSHLGFGDRDRQSPHKAVCLSNTKNLALALQMYLADNDGTFPPARRWCDSMKEYVKDWDWLQCRSAPDLESTYAFNRALGGAHMRDLADPVTTVAIFESDIGWNAAGDARHLPAAPRHLEGDNYAFADGHAQWISRKELSLGRTDLHWSLDGEE